MSRIALIAMCGRAQTRHFVQRETVESPAQTPSGPTQWSAHQWLAAIAPGELNNG